jgi:hypothetical protein
MSVELTKDSRVVTKDDNGRYVLRAEQEQVYDRENVEAMLADWERKSAELDKWLQDYDKHVEQGRQLLEQQLLLQRERVEQELKSLREGIALWTNA